METFNAILSAVAQLRYRVGNNMGYPKPLFKANPPPNSKVELSRPIQVAPKLPMILDSVISDGRDVAAYIPAPHCCQKRPSVVERTLVINAKAQIGNFI